MRRIGWAVLLLCGCAASATEPRGPLDARPVTVSRCALEGEILRCRWASGRSPQRVATDAVAYASRLGGGAFVLRRGGRLERHDRHGIQTGGIETTFVSLVAAGRYACGVSRGRVACFRDGHEDLTCGTAPFEPAIEPVAVEPGELAGSAVEPLLRAGPRVHRIGGTCGQHCVRLGCDGPRRCIDPCRPGEAPRLLARPLPGPPGEILSK